jgi:hypothetical protein
MKMDAVLLSVTSENVLRIERSHAKEVIERVKVNLALRLITFLKRWDGVVWTGLV